MARRARGLPENFTIDLPDDKPVVIGDFLDEEQPVPPIRRTRERSVEPRVERFVPAPQLRAERPVEEGKSAIRNSSVPSIIRYQLNLTPKSKVMLEELVEHVRTYSPQNDASVSEVFQGIMQLLHNAKDELELAELPRRGAWGSVTAKNFPGALSEAFEDAILRAAQKR